MKLTGGPWATSSPSLSHSHIDKTSRKTTPARLTSLEEKRNKSISVPEFLILLCLCVSSLQLEKQYGVAVSEILRNLDKSH